VHQVSSQGRQVNVRREVLADKIAAIQHRTAPTVRRRAVSQPLA
jgi:hypothetical protein